MDKTKLLSITNMSLSELEAWCTSLGEPAYRAKQMLSWVYDKGAMAFDQMSNLPKNFQKHLAGQRRVFQTSISDITQTAYGTEKFLVHVSDGNVIECVLLREGKRTTVCISTQVGCAMACQFCASGLPGLERNLTTGEIVEQALHVKNHLPREERITNIVFMGIGEPLMNYDNVIKAARIMNAEWGFGIGARHITISTVGIIDGIRRLAHEGLQINLAISLHAPDDRIRSKIIPSNKKIGVKNLIAAAREYFETTRRDISFEYLLIDGVNASRQDAESLARLLKGMQCNINVLPVNPVEEFHWRPPSRETIETFCRMLENHGLVVTLRKKKGSRINAACGQLRLQRQKFLWKNQEHCVK
ncbi:MAG: 23S rRNA (adenine(2503)-C(2))-methyltransferase [Candidatus Brocadia sp. UTAMX2]|jgi:23S rRNA (adenine2503-C2)-methyltransferase|nr:MAG: 23S rRNA (adenine(2503)-C(2))-methyltransferase [Candidatus Brocadia sp. UTAMX2]